MGCLLSSNTTGLVTCLMASPGVLLNLAEIRGSGGVVVHGVSMLMLGGRLGTYYFFGVTQYLAC